MQNNPPQNQNEAPQTHTYVGLTSSKFKERLANHKKSFKHRKYGTETTLSQKIWQLRDEGVECDIKWKIPLLLSDDEAEYRGQCLHQNRSLLNHRGLEHSFPQGRSYVNNDVK